MKKRNVLFVVTLAAACTLVGLFLRQRAPNTVVGPVNPSFASLPAPAVRTNATSTNVIAAALHTAATAGVANAEERLRKLEQLGCVPEDGDEWDFWLAQRTSWWGKPIDPKGFWKDRVLWLDTSASLAARRRGRQYPPIPYEVPSLAQRSEVDQMTTSEADRSGMHYHLTDKENAFWTKFAVTHPQPPESIAMKQVLLADEMLGSHYLFEHSPQPNLTEAGLERMDDASRKRAEDTGYPSEAFSLEALRWTYVFRKRDEYEQLFGRLPAGYGPRSSNYLARLWVDPKLITDPLTDDQLKAANAWKVAYLQRLRKENTDESYISAYLKAWNLSSNDVFVPPQ